MNNIWIEKRKEKVLEEFKFLNAGACGGYVFDVDHPTAKRVNPDTLEMTPMTTRIAIYKGRVRMVWGMTKEHSKYVKETAELFCSELIDKAIKELWTIYYKSKHESTKKAILKIIGFEESSRDKK